MPALDFTPEQFRNVLDVNVTGTFLCVQAFAREFTSRNTIKRGERSPGIEDESGLAREGGASIFLTGSMSGTVANLGLECTAYNASKAEVIHMGRNMAMEWGKKGIRVKVSLARSLDFKRPTRLPFLDALSGYVGFAKDPDGVVVVLTDLTS